ncbi:MAG: InlB B-repeat-containing protein, partial [Candidatus Methanomethylophilaceae archaeon]|nr:InlB B-repeat-containing protein [Candidatus Methanomethylophilaceae archaeon]
KVLIKAGECTVTYDAGIGLVNGQQTWSETITKGSYASLPQATHSSGAYSFAGWNVSATASEGVASYNAFKDVTLHAVWNRNTVQVSDASATVTSGQTATLPLTTDPADAVLSVVSLGGLPESSARVDGHSIELDMTDVSPGTYFVTVDASYSGYITGESVITVKVPITIVKPIEYVLCEGDSFSYTPVTNPTNAEITLVSVTKDGNLVGDMGGLTVDGRSIVGTY